MRRVCKLHLGCGNTLLPGHLNVDLAGTFVGQNHPDMVADVRCLATLATGSFAEIYASHVLEHIAWGDVELTLREWRRLLRPGGVLKICTPDMEAEIHRHLVERADSAAQRPHLGGIVADRPPRTPGHRLASALVGAPHDRPGAAHRVPWSFEFLREVLEDVGFADVRRFVSDIPDWSTRWPDSLNVAAIAAPDAPAARKSAWEITAADEIAGLRPALVCRAHAIGPHLVFVHRSPDDPCLIVPAAAQVVLDAIDGSRTVAEICRSFAAHPTLEVDEELFLGLWAQRVITMAGPPREDGGDVFVLGPELLRALDGKVVWPGLARSDP